MIQYDVIGLMSGSSLDGLDICRVVFTEDAVQGWKFEIKETAFYAYEESFRNRCRALPQGTAFELAQMHQHLGKIFATYLLDFFDKNPDSKKATLIVSPGQTIFHRPELGFTSQIGCGATIAALTQKRVVADLRSMDVALGGQGAPLVPMGEKMLFPLQKQFLNIGGICNIALHDHENVKAFDVCPGNTLLNYFSLQKGFSFDENGNLARQGNINSTLLEQLNQIEFCLQPGPKSLGTEHIYRDWLTLINASHLSVEDALCTAVEHIAMQIAQVMNNEPMLITGGGALNQYLVERIKAHSSAEILSCARAIVDFKEALIIAFLGLQRFLNRPTTLTSVTGAQRTSIGGAVYEGGE